MTVYIYEAIDVDFTINHIGKYVINGKYMLIKDYTYSIYCSTVMHCLIVFIGYQVGEELF